MSVQQADAQRVRGRSRRVLIAGAAAAAMSLSGLVGAALPAQAAQPGPAISVDPQGGEFYGGPTAVGSDITVSLTNYPLAEAADTPNVKVEYCGFTIANFRASVKACSTDPASTKTVAVMVDNGKGETFPVGDASVALRAAAGFTSGAVTVNCLVETCGYRTSSVIPTAPDPAAKTGGYITLGDNPTMSITLPNGNPIPAAGLAYKDGFTTIKVTGANFRPGTQLRLLQCDLAAHSSKCFGVSTDGNGYVDTPAADLSGGWTTEIGVSSLNKKTDGTVVFDCFVAGTECGLLTSRYDAGGDRGQEASVAIPFANPAASISVDPQGGEFYGGPIAVGSDVTLSLRNYPVATDETTPNVKVEYCGFAFANFRATVTACSTDPASSKSVAVVTDTGKSFGDAVVDLSAVAGFTTGGVTVDCLAGTCGFRTSSITPTTPDPAAKTGAYLTLGSNPTMSATLANGDPIPAAGIAYTDGFTAIKVTGKNFRPGTRMRLLECNLAEHSAKCFGVSADGNGYVDTPAADRNGTWTTEIGVANNNVRGDNTIFNCFTEGTECGLLTSRYDAGGDRGQEASVALKFAPPAKARIDVDPQGGEFYGGPLADGADIDVTVSNLPLAADPEVANLTVEYCGFQIANFRPSVTACSTDAGSIATAAVTELNSTGVLGDVTVTLKAVNTFTSGATVVDCLVDTCGFRAKIGTTTVTGGYVTLGTNPSMTATLPDGSPIPATGLAYSTGFTSIKVTGHNFRPGTKMRLLECDLAQHSSKCYGVSDDGNGYVDTPAADQDGTWVTEIGVANSNVKPDETVVFDCFADGTDCGLLTSRYDAGGDRGQEASVAIKFAPQPPAQTPSLALSKSKVRVGDTVTLTGTDFPDAATPLFVTICADPPSATNCDMTLANIGQVDYDGSGSFTSTFTVKTLKFDSGDGVIDCATMQCVIGTTNAAHPADTSYNSTAKISVDTTPAAKAPTKAKIKKVKVKKSGVVVITWAKAKAQGTPVTGYVVQAKKGKKPFKKAAAVGASKTKLKWSKAKAGNTYKFRVVAKSKAGNSTSAGYKIKIKK